MNKPRVPIAKLFVACDSIDIQEQTLRRPVTAIHPMVGDDFPTIHGELWLYALLTDGLGKHDVQLEFGFDLSVDENISLRTTSRRTIDMGTDPIAVHGLPIPVRNLPLRQPGYIDIKLLCDGVEVARTTLRVRRLP